MGTAAVTGATGFIGRHLLERLQAGGWQIRALARDPSALDEASARRHGLTPIPGALEDEAALDRLLDGADVVFHLAGRTAARSAKAFLEANAEGTARLVRRAGARPMPPRFVLVSSLTAREPGLSGYAASKLAAEKALIAEGHGRLVWTIVRPPAVYGPGDRATLPFFRCAARGIVPAPGSPTDARFSAVYVQDLAAGLIELATLSEAAGTTVEVDDGTEGGHVWADMADAAGAALGRKVRAVRMPRGLLFAAGAGADLVRATGCATPILSMGKARELAHPDWVSRAVPDERVWVWHGSTGLVTGVAQTVAWYKRHSWL